jgi:hypothetical protein
LAEDGAVLIEGFLNSEQLARCRSVYDWCVENPGPLAVTLFAGTGKEIHNDNANPRATQRLNELVSSLPFGELFANLWGSTNVWYFAEEIFLKSGGKGGRTPWHQDTSYLPWGGMHWANALSVRRKMITLANQALKVAPDPNNSISRRLVRPRPPSSALVRVNCPE